MNKIKLLNVRIDNITTDELLERLTEGVLVTPNVDDIMKHQRDAVFHEMADKAEFSVCDSKIVLLSSKLLRTPLKEAIPGSSFFPKYCEYHANDDVKIFLLGAKEGVGEIAKKKINERIGREIVVDTYSPPFGFENNEDECKKVVDVISHSSANVVLVGLGNPKQTKWIFKNKDLLPNIKVYLALGATIDFEAGNIKRAPKLYQKLAMEWFYRFCKEPRRLFRRYFIYDLPYVWYLTKQIFGKYKDPFEKMIIRSKAPLRLGLAGGGSDVSPYSDIYGGLILNATINLYAYCTIEETNDGKITINSYDAHLNESYPSKNKLEIDGKASLIKGVYNRIVRDYNFEPLQFKITTYNDAPAGSGLGTSSTMVVCILKAFIEWLGLPLGDYELARLAYEIERIDLGLSGGKQDQYAAAFGGFNYMEFHKDDIVIVNPLKVKRWIVDELEASMLLYYTGASRSSAKIIDDQKKNTTEGKTDAIEAMHKIKQSAVDMKLAILKGDVKAFGDILRESWENKKRQSAHITNPMIQHVMEVAEQHGALGGKVSGAGGGGFITFVVEPTRKKELEAALNELEGYTVPFQFSDGGAHGWKIYPTDNVSHIKVK